MFRFVLICFVFLSLHLFNISSWKKTFFSISLFTSPPSRWIWKNIILFMFSLKILNLNRPPPTWTWFEWNYVGLGHIIDGIGSAFPTDFKKLYFKKIQRAIFEIIEAEGVRFVKKWVFGSEILFSLIYILSISTVILWYGCFHNRNGLKLEIVPRFC